MLELKGEAGNFKAKIVRKARFIEEDKCVACGDCIEGCPVAISNDFNAHLVDRKAVYKYFPQAVPSTFTIDRLGTSPCKDACPAGISVQGYVALISQGRYQEAISLILKDLPLPGVLGRVCPHPCEDRCRRLEVDEALTIRDLKRFAADRVKLADLPKPTIEERSEKVAIIGSGPAGLTVAYYLRLKGYQVTMFEALPELGGMLRVGIPDYRLPPEVLDNEIDHIIGLGVEVRTNQCLGKDFSLQELEKQGFKAVFLGIGAHLGVKMKIAGEDDFCGVIDAVDFLREVNLGNHKLPGKRLVVVGGGNVAVDAARTALRLGAKEVSIVYRRSRQEMPAYEEEICEALAEKVKLHYLTAPVSIKGTKGKVTGFECIKTELGEPDDSGRRRPVPVAGSEFIIKCDAVIPAIGQRPDIKWTQAVKKLKTDNWSNFVVNQHTLQTSISHLFAAGDAVTGPATIIEAVGSAHRAAEAIHRYLKGEDLNLMAQEIASHQNKVATDREIPQSVTPSARAETSHRSVKESAASFKEVNLGFSETVAQNEAQRCLNCGICSECYQCVDVCKAQAVNFQQKDRQQEIEVGAVILATGFDLYDVSPLTEYGWGKIKNVITAMQFERMICASGPTNGHLKRPSDGKEPQSLAFIQCVGSRDARHQKYCSAVCCMHASKEAILANEHYPNLRSTIFYMDMRAVGKGFQEYIQRAKKQYQVEYVRSRPGKIIENKESQNPIIHYENTVAREFKTREFDLVILSQALMPTQSNFSIAEKLNIDLDEFGFIVAQDNVMNPFSTSREGIFGCGFCQSPMDVPDSVVRASAAAAKVAELLAQSS